MVQGCCLFTRKSNASFEIEGDGSYLSPTLIAYHGLAQQGLENRFSLFEQRLHVAVEEVLGDAAGDDGAIVVEGFDVGFTHHRGDFEADV